ncbi:MAG: TetR/AcrR family transcriptional regulator [Candidatus Izimaplasma sp.]|nr:TetR/AcrR family transcriptional regulator [Candidatus Izimaplasma bacterium]
MSEFLEKIDVRRNRILEAALVEFADKGYRKASTNTIVREAKVSKGLLFHYFISKKGLYVFIFKHAKDTVKNDTYNKVDFADRDVLNRLYSATVAKIDSYNKHKLFTKILERHELIQDEEILKETKAIIVHNTEESFEKIFNNIDYHLFDETVNIDRSLNVMRWTIERITNDWKVSNGCKFTKKTLEVLKMDISHFLDLFRAAFYR